jgi:hypothetical protein
MEIITDDTATVINGKSPRIVSKVLETALGTARKYCLPPGREV